VLLIGLGKRLTVLLIGLGKRLTVLLIGLNERHDCDSPDKKKAIGAATLPQV
jgi:hypothetical protein